MKWSDWLMTVLFLFAIVFTALALVSQWELMLIVYVILLMLILYKMALTATMHETVIETKRDNHELTTLLSAKLDGIADGVEQTRKDLNRTMFVVMNRIEGVRLETKIKQEDQYRELVKSIISVENKVTTLRKTLEAAYESIDNRIKKVEDEHY
ncbi:MAG: hypothetical protein HY832_03065 [Candidatus Aenigmarchaeota archaeon]|nr:hypothetical protein [Candidatus Aenigmarchaeota archaeon]